MALTAALALGSTMVAAGPSLASPTAITAAGAPRAGWVVAGPAAEDPRARVLLDPADGSLDLVVTHLGSTVLEPSSLGVRTAAADLTQDLRFLGRVDRRITQRYTMTTGKSLQRRVDMRESTFRFASPAGVRMDLVVRAADDGIAYRYVLPAANTVTGEASDFTVAADARATLLPYNPQYENPREITTAAAAPAGEFGYPSLFEVGSNAVMLTEAGVDGRYSGSRLVHEAGSATYSVELADEQVSTEGRLATPWRVAIIGDLETITESTMVDDLAPPSRLADTSWVRPGKVAWSWLSENTSPRDPERQRDYVDFAARNNWPFVLVDEGWDSSWTPELVRYARARGVDVLLWFHWRNLDTEAERDYWLDLMNTWGVAGVKIDFMESDSQERFQWYDAVLQATAERHLMVNFHGSTIPHGMARTWPHVMTMEAVRGEENGINPAYNTMIPFTRNVVGSMDYTPTRFAIDDRPTSDAHELALPVLYESGWTHFADRPEGYEAEPVALRFLNQVPAVWDETQFVAGLPGSHAVLARRNADRWFVGGITSGDARTLQVPMQFLGSGTWQIEMIEDSAGGLHRTTRTVRSSNVLTIDAARNGGFAAVACRYPGPGRTCDEPLSRVPVADLDVTSSSTSADPGQTIGVRARVTVPYEDDILRGVTLTVAPPAGWTASGATVTRSRLRSGQVLTGTWSVTVPAGQIGGDVDIPVVATFRTGQGDNVRTIHVEQVAHVRVALRGEVFVSDLGFTSETNGYGPVERDQSNGENAGGDGQPLTISGVVFDKGLGTHASSTVGLSIAGDCSRLQADVGLDDEVEQAGSVEFRVLGDGELLWSSGVVRSGAAPMPLDVDVSGVDDLVLQVTDGGDGINYDHADWGGARLTCGA